MLVLKRILECFIPHALYTGDRSILYRPSMSNDFSFETFWKFITVAYHITILWIIIRGTHVTWSKLHWLLQRSRTLDRSRFSYFLYYYIKRFISTRTNTSAISQHRSTTTDYGEHTTIGHLTKRFKKKKKTSSRPYIRPVLVNTK